MCGITGFINAPNAASRALLSLERMRERGKDRAGLFDGARVLLAPSPAELKEKLQSRSNIALGHVLHSVVGHCPQPIKAKGVLVANCEIYNWKELAARRKINPKSDSELLLMLLDELPSLEPEPLFRVLQELDGVYAFAYLRDSTLVLARDIIGVKPLWYAHQNGFAFASQKNAISALNSEVLAIAELNPRKILIYNLEADRLQEAQRPFFAITEKGGVSEEAVILELSELIKEAVAKRLPRRGIKAGILFSGGIDSTIIAKMCYEMGVEAECYTAVFSGTAKAPHDLEAAREVAERYGFRHVVISIGEEEAAELAKEVCFEIGEPHPVKTAVGMPFLAASKEAARRGCRVLFSGLGSEELFAGYQRHRNSADLNKECLSGIRMLYERDLYRDDVLTMNRGVELRLPFLDKKLVSFSLRIPAELKIKDGMEKYALRRAALLLGVKKEDAFRPKKAAQYGSGFDKALVRLSKRRGLSRARYLKSLFPEHSQRLGVLCSGGKDSWYAAYVMNSLNYELACLITLRSRNPHSYMFHTPAIEVTELQGIASGMPLITQETAGEKELELEDLRAALEQAKKEHRITGVVTGALFSQYQRDRIEAVCDSAGLKVFSPLWHIDQAQEIRELLSKGFSVIVTAVAAEGLSKSWLGRKIDEKALGELMLLNKKLGLNVAGEGGEYETLVLDCPLFKRRILVEEFESQGDGTSSRLIVKRASLEKKS